jgi:hypothetical protein
MSSIARAFTLRRKRTDSGVGESNKNNDDIPSPPPPPRSVSMRFSKKPIDVKKISSPVQLLSTTNMLSYDAPDVAVIQAQRNASMSVSSGSSSRISTDDDASSTSSRSRDTQLTDASSVGSISPVTSPSTDKKMTFFEFTPAFEGASPLRRSISTLEIKRRTLVEENASELPRAESPAVPQRHPSHSKKASMDLARKRSMHTMSTSSLTRAHSIASTPPSQKEVNRSSFDFFNSKASDPASSPASSLHPFGKELAQLDEVAEEFSGAVSDAERTHDLQVMQQRGLVRFCAAEYMTEIEPLFGSLHGFSSNHLSVPALTWI